VECVVREVNRVISIARYLDVDDCLISKVHNFNYLDDDHGNYKIGLLASRNAESPNDLSNLISALVKVRPYYNPEQL